MYRDSDGNGSGQIILDEWGLDTPKLTDMNLLEVLRLGESDEDLKEDPTTISMRTKQPTLEEVIHWLRLTERVSISKVYRLATKHGLLLIRDDSRCDVLQQAMQSRLERSRESYNAYQSKRLARHTALPPTDAIDGYSNFRVYSWVHGALDALAYDSGLHLGHLTTYCLLSSLLTLPALGGYTQTARRDTEQFWQHITARTAELNGVETLRP